MEEPLLLCNSDLHHLVAFFIGALKNSAFQRRAKKKNLFLDIETTIRINSGSIFDKIFQCQNWTEQVRRFDMNQDKCENKNCASTHFLQIQKNQLIDLQEHLERFYNVLPVFDFNSGKFDLDLIKSYLLPIVVNERDIESTVIKKANQSMSIKFVDIQILDQMNFLGGATSLDSFLKAYKTSETKGFYPYEWFDQPDKMQNTELPPYHAFYCKFCSCNLLEAKHKDHVDLLKIGMTTEQAIVNLKLPKPAATVVDNYQYLHQNCKQQQNNSFKCFCAGILINMLFLPRGWSKNW